MGIFSAKKTKNQYAKVTTKSKLTLDITESSQWKKCSKCNEIIYNEDLKNNLNVCPKCGNYFPLNAFERIELLIDERTFEEQDITLNSKDFLNFPMYKEKLEESIDKSRMLDAVISGSGKINGISVNIAVMDF